MDIEHLRNLCLSLGEVEEKTPFGKFAARFDSVLVFYVCGHMFCMFDMDSFEGVAVKGNPDRIAELLETRSACQSHRNMSRKHWIQLNFGGDIKDCEIEELIRQSYEIVRSKYEKRKPYDK